MSELRWHPLLEEWVTVAPWRQDRTYHPPPDHCPLCPTRPGQPETEIPEPAYYIAVFENRFPSFTGEQGRCEVVCYTPDHDSSLGEQSSEHVRDPLELWPRDAHPARHRPPPTLPCRSLPDCHATAASWPGPDPPTLPPRRLPTDPHSGQAPIPGCIRAPRRRIHRRCKGRGQGRGAPWSLSRTSPERGMAAR